MTVRDILLLGNPRLRERSSELVDRGELWGIVADLRDTLTHLQETKGIGRGLAAPQIGYLKRVVYVQTHVLKTAMVNPRIIWRSDEVFEVWDSCFSFDITFYVSISRSRRIRVEYLDGDWVKHTDEFGRLGGTPPARDRPSRRGPRDRPSEGWQGHRHADRVGEEE